MAGVVEIDMSLDEFIRKKNGAQFQLLNHRKRDKDIDVDKESLDLSLESYIRDRDRLLRGQKVVSNNQSSSLASTGCGKFDRRSLRENSSDEDEDPKVSRNTQGSSDIEMTDQTLPLIKEEEDDSDLDGIMNFTTAESRDGIRVRSQKWRLLPENLINRPKGMKRLEVLPYDEHERYKRVHNGKVQKNKKNRSRTSSFSSIGSKASDFSAGTFVEKGSFTYKFGERCSGQNEEVIGIERSKFIQPVPPQAATASAPVNINMNWTGFFQGLTECVDKVTPAAPKAAPADVPKANGKDDLSSAAMNLLTMLQAKRDREKAQRYNLQVQKEIAIIQNRPIVIEDRGDEEFDIMASSGDGIDDFGGKPHATQLPFNIRFS